MTFFYKGTLLASITLVFTFFIISSCSTTDSSKRQKLSKKEVEDLKEIQRNSVIHKKGFWKKYLKRPPKERIYEAPSELVNYLTRDNKIWGYAAIPKAYNLGNLEREIFKEVIEEFPKGLREMMKDNMVAVFVVEGLGSSALTDGIRAFPKKSFMVFDRKVFQKRANDWCTWKENTPFKGSDVSLKCTIRSPKENGIKEAFQYIFAHELAHVFNRQNKDLLPFWDDNLSEVEFDRYPYLKISWIKGKDYFSRKQFEEEFKDIRYYSNKTAQIDSSKAIGLYKKLSKSKIPSLYGVTNVWDDFAEGFVIYYHTKILKRPFFIKLKSTNESFIFKSCLQTNKCKKKEGIFKKIFSN